MSQERAEDTPTSPPLGSSPLLQQVNRNAASNGGDDTESSQDSYPICLKCSKAITHHIPYKYLGATFHAVCLKCNFCAKNLSAKPFIIQDTKIFCSNVCKANFEGAAAVTSESTHQQNLEKPSSKDATQSEEEGSTIFEVLDDIQEGNIELPKPPRRIPILIEDEPYRLTDYPARRNSHDSPSRRSSLSISAVSDSSLTSEGSSVMSYDANKIPKKKILKHPHGQRKHSRNRVRFNLTEDESDNSSVYSFESMSTASEIYGRARSGVSEVMHGWKGEFEVSPPRGSTGLTPGKHVYRRNHHHHHHHHGHQHPHHHHLYVRPDQRWSPTLHSTHSDSSLMGQSAANGSLSPNMQSLLGGSSSASPTHVMSRHAHSFSASDTQQVNISGKVMTNGGPSSAIHGLRRSTSPLTSATFSSSDRHLQSTPLSHSHSESAISAKSNALNSSFVREHRLTVLKLDSSSIPELEESTLEDRKRGHIFQFPQNSPVSQGNVSGQQGSLTSPTSHPNFQTEAKNHGAKLAANRMLFTDDDDANDYDHLSPLKNGNEPVDDNEPKEKEETKSNKAGIDDALPGFLRIKRIGNKEKKPSKENAIASQNSQDSTGAKKEDVSQEEEVPPPVPKKLRSRVQSEVILMHKSTDLEVEGDKTDSALNTVKEVPDVVAAGNSSPMPEATKGRRKAEMRASNMDSISRAIKSSSDLDKLYFKQNKQKAAPTGVDFGEMQATMSEEIEESKRRRRKKSKSPPPIPKKTTHIRRQDRDAFGNPLVGMTTLGYSSSSQSTNETNPSQETSADDTNIVPPPPEFSDVGFFSDPVGSGGPFQDLNLLPDDGLGASNSNTTLVSETTSELSREIQELPAGLSASKDISSSSSYSQRQHKNRHKGLSQHDLRTRKTGETPIDVFGSSTRSGPTENQAGNFVDHGGNIRVKKMASESVLHSKSTKEASNLVVSSNHTTVTKVSQTLEKDHSASSPVPGRPNLKESKSNTGKNQSVPGSRRIPSRPAPPPPNRPAAPAISSSQGQSSAANEKVTEEEKQALKLACPPNGTKLPMMAPTMHDTEKHIQDMMTEISIEQSRPNPLPFGMCIACTEPISSRKDFCSHEGVLYHMNCFQCSRCATSLRGRTVLKIKSFLYCRDCYSKVSSSSGMRLGISHRVPQNKFHGPPGSEYYGPQSGGFHPPTSGGQITSV